jgi:hypothetical protein
MPDIVTRVKKIESEGHGFVICSAAMQSIEICGPIGRQVNNLGINSQGLTQPRRFLDNAGITLRPVSAIHRVEPNATVTHMDLQPVAVRLQLVRPTGTG